MASRQALRSESRSAPAKSSAVPCALKTLDHDLEARVLHRLAAAVGALVRARLARELVGQEDRQYVARVSRTTAVEVARPRGLVPASVSLHRLAPVALDDDARQLALALWLNRKMRPRRRASSLGDLLSEASHSESVWLMLRRCARSRPRRGCSSCLIVRGRAPRAPA